MQIFNLDQINIYLAYIFCDLDWLNLIRSRLQIFNLDQINLDLD